MQINVLKKKIDTYIYIYIYPFNGFCLNQFYRPSSTSLFRQELHSECSFDTSNNGWIKRIEEAAGSDRHIGGGAEVMSNREGIKKHRILSRVMIARAKKMEAQFIGTAHGCRS